MGQEGYGKNMPEKDTTRQSSMLDTEQATLLYPSSAIAALEQMYQQSRFEAQCWFVSSLITAIIGTILILSTILFLLLFKDTAQENESGHITLIVANIINGAVQHLIVSQARAANRRTDKYAQELSKEEKELHIPELLHFIITTLPEGEERNALLIQILMNATSDMAREQQSPLSISALRHQKNLYKNNSDLP